MLKGLWCRLRAGGGMGLPIIGKLLGHFQPATTNRYAHLDADPLRKASDAVGSAITAAMGDAEPDAKRLPGEVIPLRQGDPPDGRPTTGTDTAARPV